MTCKAKLRKRKKEDSNRKNTRTKTDVTTSHNLFFLTSHNLNTNLLYDFNATLSNLTSCIKHKDKKEFRHIQKSTKSLPQNVYMLLCLILTHTFTFLYKVQYIHSTN